MEEFVTTAGSQTRPVWGGGKAEGQEGGGAFPSFIS